MRRRTCNPYPLSPILFLASLEQDLPQSYASPDRQIAVDLDALGPIGPGSSGHLRRVAARLLQAKTLARSRRPQL